MDFLLKYNPGFTLAAITLPASKSVLARMMIVCALERKRPKIRVSFQSDDIAILVEALRNVGCRRDIFVGASGTAMRFLTAYCSILPGVETILAGTERLHARPVGPLVDTLRSLGAQIEYLGTPGFLPVRICGREIAGGYAEIDAAGSSQFISALMLVAPKMPLGLRLRIVSSGTGSMPYVDMTRRLLISCGINVGMNDDGELTIPSGRYIIPSNLHLESDWSAAAFFYEYVAIAGYSVIMRSLGAPETSLQGDAKVADIFRLFGVETREMHEKEILLYTVSRSVDYIDIDMRSTPDLVPAVAVASAVRNIPFRIRGIGNLRIKESDRIESISYNLRKLGYLVETLPDEICWSGEIVSSEINPILHSFSDHRIAMAFAIAAAAHPGIVLTDIHSVKKSFPKFWTQVSRLGIKYSPTTLARQQ